MRPPHGKINIRRYLKRRGACAEGVNFASKYDTLAEAWTNCICPDWMFWMLKKIDYHDDRKLRLFACWCVRRVWHLLTDERSKQAVEVAERYAARGASSEQMAAAGEAAVAAAWEAAGASARAAAWAAAWAAAGESADAAGASARAAAEEAACASARAAAGESADAAAGDAAGDAAGEEQANQLRAMIGNPFTE
ncbi:MAG: hypothetical protein AAB538_04500 [Patescibacteria group bacterium]